jgi:FkbM family methyltransferase
VKETAEVTLTIPGAATPLSLVGPPEDAGVMGEIQRSGGNYEPHVMRALRRLIRKDAVVFDVGANIGVFALVLSRLAPHGRVFAFEPAPENFDYLEKNLAANGAGNVVAERCAVYDETGTVPFVFSPASPSGSFVPTGVSAGAAHAGDSQQVEAVSMDDYVRRRGLDRVDLIMVDAEGAEMAVLRGAPRTLDTFRPALLVEVNPVSLRRFGGTSYRDLVEVLRRGRTLFSITENGLPARIASDRHLELLLQEEGVVDLLCLPDGHPARTLAATARGRKERLRLEAAFNDRTPPGNNFVVEPSFVLSPPPEPVQGMPDHVVWLTVAVHNTSPYWYSSDFLYHPVHLCYRWVTDDGGQLDVIANRGRFETPLAPGATAAVRIAVRLPNAPGDYRLALTLLQESFAWFDDLDPSLRLMLTGAAVQP